MNCSDDDNSAGSDGNSAAGVIWPLAVGNEWNYVYFEYDSTGAPLDEGADKILITDTTTIDEISWYAANTETMLQNRSGGCWWIPAGGGAPSVLFKYPAAVGDVYTSGGLNELVMQLQDKNVQVTVGQQAYIAYKYKRLYIGSDLRQYYYVVPSVGIVKWEDTDESGSYIAKMVLLTDFTLN
jgi:hypothetical protein